MAMDGEDDKATVRDGDRKSLFFAAICWLQPYRSWRLVF